MEPKRHRDAERSRRLLLEAALEEFASKGYAGARVQDIADRAGVNKRLINYYFGGKDGLYRELQRGWLEHEASFATPDVALADLSTRYLREALADPRAIRLVLWHGLTGGTDAPTEPPDDLTDLRRRQADGELAPDLDPAVVMLAMMSMVMAPVAFPHLVRQLFDRDPRSPEFQDHYAEQLRLIIQKLR